MDGLTAQRLSHELMVVDDHDGVQYPWQLAKSIKDSTLDSLCISNNEYSRIAEASQVCILQQPAAAKQAIMINDLTPYTSSSQKTSHEHDHHQFSSFPSNKIISFGEIYGAPEFDKSVKRYDDVNMLPIVENQNNNNVLAERKRRQRLTQLFVSLSTIIPDLNKSDKASILAGAIEYLKQLQQRIQVLEEEEEEKEKRRKYEKSASVSYNQSEMDQSSPGPEVKVKTCNGNILMEIYCRKRPRILNEILCEIEKLHLCITSTSVIPFGNTTLHITITAQESDEFCKRAQDVAKAIRETILN